MPTLRLRERLPSAFDCQRMFGKVNLVETQEFVREKAWAPTLWMWTPISSCQPAQITGLRPALSQARGRKVPARQWHDPEEQSRRTNCLLLPCQPKAR